MAKDISMVAGESKLLNYGVVDEDGAAVTVTGATCLWELSRYPGDVAIVTKTTSDGITASGTTVAVELDTTDTETLDGAYWCELTITDSQSNTSKTQSTVFVNAEVLAV